MMPSHLLPLLVVLVGSARIFTDAAAPDVQRLLAQQRSLEPFTATTIPRSVADVLTAIPEGRRCADTASIPIAGLNLTAEEIALLPQLCWHADEVASFPEPARVAGVEADSRGIPPGVICKHVQWCEKDGGACAEVCERGSVFVEPWLQHALRTQLRLSRRVPLCYSSMLGTHNSGITLADGYGTLDPYFQKYFEWIKWASAVDRLQTNDQVLSLTDQLNLGVRMIEMDTHWVQGDFKIAHCGGFHSFLNLFIKAVNLVAKLLHHHIRWDTETIGCDPSLSSIPTGEQRALQLAMQEVADWMALPGNEEEFVVLFFDDQMDINDWGLVPLLLQRIAQIFPVSTIYTPFDQVGRGDEDWPSMEEMLAMGKRVLLLNGVNYGAHMQPLIFKRGTPVCNFVEPNLTTYISAPGCIVNPDPKAKHIMNGGKTQQGQLYRMTTCEITYGPMNCDFVFRGSNEPLLDETTLPDVTRCGVNAPSPDILTPQRSASTIWTWAPGHPFTPQDEPRLLRSLYPVVWQQRSGLWRAAVQLGELWRPRWAALQALWPRVAESLDCAVVSASDGRWRVAACSGAYPTACRAVAAPIKAAEVFVERGAGDSDSNQQAEAQPLWAFGAGPRGGCPDGYEHVVPRTSKENMYLQIAMHGAGAESAWLPVTGPEWEV